jgi:hypothetical protein
VSKKGPRESKRAPAYWNERFIEVLERGGLRNWQDVLVEAVESVDYSLHYKLNADARDISWARHLLEVKKEKGDGNER